MIGERVGAAFLLPLVSAGFGVVLACGGVGVSGEPPGVVSVSDDEPVAELLEEVVEAAPMIISKSHHCTADEVAWFRCIDSGGQLVSVCSSWPFSSSVGYVQVRSGLPGRAVVSLPDSKVAFSTAFEIEHSETMGSQGGLPYVVTELSTVASQEPWKLTHRIVPEQDAWLDVHVDGVVQRVSCSEDIEGEIQQMVYDATR